VNIPSNIITLIIGIAVTLISLWYGQHHGLMPVAASNDATQVDDIFNLMMTIATGLFLIVEGVIIYCLIRFRRRKGDQTDGPAIEGNVPLEILWTAIPTIIVFVLAIYSFEIYNSLGGLDPIISQDAGPQQEMAAGEGTEKPTAKLALASHHSHLALGIGPAFDETGENPPLVVDVKAIQYAWIFTYPETGIISGELHLPKDRPVRLNMTAGDVIHAFWVPQLRLKQDVIPGRETVLAFTANREGSYPVICAELCGSYHGGMKAMLYVENEETFAQWVEANKPVQTAALEETVALNAQSLSDGEFLAPYAEEMGIQKETVGQVKSLAHHHHLGHF
jgi:cytochrome c oxidase subunit 2